MSGPQRTRLADGRLLDERWPDKRWPDERWHWQHGPIDLVIGAEGDSAAVAAAEAAAWDHFQGLLAAISG